MNNMNYDAFFIKSQMKFPDQVEQPPTNGNILVGSTFRFIMTSLEDDQQYVRVATQLAQSTYDSLDLPYVFVGIGRSNNYIEQFNAGYMLKNRLDQVKVYSPLIPNSNIIIYANPEQKQDWDL